MLATVASAAEASAIPAVLPSDLILVCGFFDGGPALITFPYMESGFVGSGLGSHETQLLGPWPSGPGLITNIWSSAADICLVMPMASVATDPVSDWSVAWERSLTVFF